MHGRCKLRKPCVLNLAEFFARARLLPKTEIPGWHLRCLVKKHMKKQLLSMMFAGLTMVCLGDGGGIAGGGVGGDGGSGDGNMTAAAQKQGYPGTGIPATAGPNENANAVGTQNNPTRLNSPNANNANHQRKLRTTKHHHRAVLPNNNGVNQTAPNGANAPVNGANTAPDNGNTPPQ
jgi:hypothetical protein